MPAAHLRVLTLLVVPAAGCHVSSCMAGMQQQQQQHTPGSIDSFLLAQAGRAAGVAGAPAGSFRRGADGADTAVQVWGGLEAAGRPQQLCGASVCRSASWGSLDCSLKCWVAAHCARRGGSKGADSRELLWLGTLRGGGFSGKRAAAGQGVEGGVPCQLPCWQPGTPHAGVCETPRGWCKGGLGARWGGQCLLGSSDGCMGGP